MPQGWAHVCNVCIFVCSTNKDWRGKNSALWGYLDYYIGYDIWCINTHSKYSALYRKYGMVSDTDKKNPDSWAPFTSKKRQK